MVLTFWIYEIRNAPLKDTIMPITHIGNEKCTRCNGASRPCPVCNPADEPAASDTPETDEAEYYDPIPGYPAVTPEHAKFLELRLNECRETLAVVQRTITPGTQIANLIDATLTNTARNL